MYDLCVIGAGCIGSAAAWYGSKYGRVCLIGPPEPKVRDPISHRDIFGAHYDEGRITRKSDSDHVMSTLARESIARYRDIEKQSGLKFYNEVGYIICGTRGSGYMLKNRKLADEFHINAKYLGNNDLTRQFPFLNFSKLDVAVHEENSSGYISPRRLTEAHRSLAKQNGCDAVDEIARDVKRLVFDGRYVMRVTTDSGRQIYAKKVMLTTGAFTSFRCLLPGELKVDVELNPITVARVEISEEDYEKIRNMPSISYTGYGADDWNSKFKRTADNKVQFYMLPPVRYPDGKIYIKLGHYHEDYPRVFHTVEEVKQWYYSGGDQKVIENTVALIKDIVKGITILSTIGDCCVITTTPTGRPYIDLIHSQLGVALGGNGGAAKSGDEIGRIAVDLLMKNKWTSKLPKDAFSVRFKNNSKL